MHLSVFLESLIQDLRYGLRGLVRNPIFTLTAILAAALGIGATTAVFSVVDRILFRSLPYPQAERLVSLGMMAPLDSNEFLFPEAYFDWRKHQTPFKSITSFTAGVVECDLTAANPARLGCASVEGNFLSTLGLAPVIGRDFTLHDDQPNAPKVALMSCGLWQSRFGRDRNIAGKLISLDGQAVAIAGVLPAEFEMPTLARADLLLPETLNEATDRNGRALRLFARLNPGTSVEQAQAAMQPLFQRSLESVPAPFRKEVRFRIRSLRDRQVQDARLAAWVLLGSVVAVLLIACANIANLLLARSIGRRRELAIRTALGAGRTRLIRQMLTESALLGVVGGAAGCALAWALLRMLVGIAPNGFLRLEQAGLDGRVLLFALGGSLLSGLLFGLAPAMQRARAESLTGSRLTAGRRLLLRECLVSAQIAVSLVLLTGAGLLLRSLWKLESVPLGIQTEHVITAEFTLGKQTYSQNTRQLQFFDDLETRIAHIPGVAAMTISDSLPLIGGMRSRPLAAIQVEGQPPFSQGTGGMVSWRYMTPGYFRTLGIPIVRGRAFGDEDRAPAVNSIILSESLARRLFPNGNALNRRLRAGDWATVVGIAAEVRNAGPMKPSDPEYYILRKRIPNETWRNQMPGTAGWRHAFIAVRTPVDARTMTDWMQKEISSLDPALPVTFTTMRERTGRFAQQPRFNALLLGLFAGMGALLAAIGIYGVMAFLIEQRVQEIGVRMALGATGGAIIRLMLSRATRWTVAGTLLGISGSLFAARALRALLFQVPPQDPWTFGLAVPCLLLITLTSAWFPARRAARIDPIEALRHE